MVALEVGLPSLPPSAACSLAPSLRPGSRRAPSFPLRPPPRLRPPRLRTARSQPLAAGLSRSPSESGAGRPCGPDSAPGGRDGAPIQRGGRGAGGGGAAGRSPGRNQGWAGGGDAGVPEPRSRSSEPASREDREGGAPPEPAELPAKCDAPAGLGRAAAAGAARREDAPELRGAGRRGRAAPAGGGGPGLRPERAPCPARADGPEPARSGRAGQVGGGPSPGTRSGGWAGDQTNSRARALSRPLPGSLCVCKLPAGAAPGGAGPRPAHFVPARAGCSP